MKRKGNLLVPAICALYHEKRQKRGQTRPHMGAEMSFTAVFERHAAPSFKN
jgi:hypothetical protein